MPLAMRYKEPQHIPQSQSDQPRHEKRNFDPPQILAGHMPKDIIQRITMPLKSTQLLPGIQLLRAGTLRLARF